VSLLDDVVDSKEGDMERFRLQAVRAVVGSLAVIAAGCGTESGLSTTEASQEFPPGLIEIAPAGAIVGTSVTLLSHLRNSPWHYGAEPIGNSGSYAWDFGDGFTATGGEAMSHAYATEGTYFATVAVSGGEAGSAQATSNISVRSVTGQWSGNFGRVSITQDGLGLRGRYLDDPKEGIVQGRVGETGTVTFTVTRPGLDPVTFTGTAGPDVMTLVGTAKGRDAVERPWKLDRN
jgi:hypothetical protein